MTVEEKNWFEVERYYINYQSGKDWELDKPTEHVQNSYLRASITLYGIRGDEIKTSCVLSFYDREWEKWPDEYITTDLSVTWQVSNGSFLVHHLPRVLDLLRNEKPIYFWLEEKLGRIIISTSKKPTMLEEI